MPIRLCCKARYIALLFLLFLFSDLGLFALTSEETCGSKDEIARKDISLRTTASGLLKVIQRHSGPEFMAFVDSNGIFVDGGHLSQREIQNEFRQKTGLYCLLFSTKCLTSAKFPRDVQFDPFDQPESYSDWIAHAGKSTLETSIFYGGEDKPCIATVFVHKDRASHIFPETIELGFVSRNGIWKFDLTPTAPKGIASLDLPNLLVRLAPDVSVEAREGYGLQPVH
jgi:hypothetical protein